MTVERLENEMSADELNEWIEFAQVEPFGNEERTADRRNALNCFITNRGSDKKLEDYLLYEQIKEESEYSDWETKLIAAMTKI